MSKPIPRQADLEGPHMFRIEWNNGVVHVLTARELRLACPCASCVDEHSGRPLLDPAAVPEAIELLAAELVGRYALQFTWSDGHRTGIFSWPLLYGLAVARGRR
jgi:DUF971 family protein